MKSERWSSIKNSLALLQNGELLELLGQLYQLNKENKYFISAKCVVDRHLTIQPYKMLIKQFISPEIKSGHERIEKAKARKAISDYWKATADYYGKIELMIYYVECGTQFTLTYGDIDEPFYNSLASMFGDAIEEVKKISMDEISKDFIYRLQEIVHDARAIGWGYGDELSNLFEEASFECFETS